MGKLLKSVALVGILALFGLTTASAQVATNTPTGSFFTSVQSYFTSFNTNLDGTFEASKGTVWTSADSLQGGAVPLANSIGLSYKVYKLISAESVTRNSGIAGTLVSEQAGLGLNFAVHDTRLTAYLDGGYAFGEPGGTTEKLYAEVGLRVTKALTEHTFAGVGVGAQLPANRQVFSAIVGFTF